MTLAPNRVSARCPVPDDFPDVVDAIDQAPIKPMALEVRVRLGLKGNAGQHHVIMFLTGRYYRKDGTPGLRETSTYLEYGPVVSAGTTPAPQWALDFADDLLRRFS